MQIIAYSRTLGNNQVLNTIIKLGNKEERDN